MAVWVVGDIHGCYDTFMTLLENPEIREDDRIILIGDIIDRGRNVLKMLNWAMDNVSDDGRYQMICGNHEDNIIRDFERVQADYPFSPDIDFRDASILKMECHYEFDSYMHHQGFNTIGSIEHFVEWFRGLPLYKKVDVQGPGGTVQSYVIAHGWYRKGASRKDILWERDVDWFGRFLADYVPESDEILIHGHTPTLNENGYANNAEVCFREHSINIDCGACFENYEGKLAAIRLEDKKVIYQPMIHTDSKYAFMD
ncbi:MAG: metallophosphoesterase [Lachnospiraceae bacterium]|nr:metallophosphoesterase [Lachnospiraceae bacterium]